MEKNRLTLDEALEMVSVYEPEFLDGPNHPKGYYGVAVDAGAEGSVIAYFVNEQLAYRFRLDYINHLLNG